ncbi:phosphoribosylamine--glycine ligase [Aliarcobacter cryaerophilus]|uniref:Phosphoribosylamine--glycine ligase n=2 Tax=Arcobacteraceae TaxID=2808963 RepID=A0AAU0P2S1_9BACT|nr:phosphoribosylamine--glycine ligase [Aliarcobacter cryaerophilus]NCB11816.1 phosphoribosylamine--glycine ligase [Erysipelotrichia bacterium]WNL17838.1 phosphoribosylamine--glycine ligase [Arcobacter sp. AZ-2023]WPD02813.1 phosphoribosylamine--glycine ligase [Arcobacter sp. DSM 115972]MCT7463430.1 phosphoribosylamine--glycine ligase [Aliarcobacter cryaerophilus]MCT7467302.1 phosphoribosylamine--glycine ligase [Aliarcobacter cryaerophilus]
MNILILGSGGREYSIGLALKNEKSHNLYFMPGNGATSNLGKNINITDYEKLAIFAKENSIDLTIVGPEGPLVDGVVDIFKKYELTIFGPSKEAAQLEGSKAYMKNILKKYNIPTAAFIETSNKQDAYDFIDGMKNLPIVVKADGLCGGKGVIIAQSKEEAKKTVDDMLNGSSFGEAGEKVIIEEFLDGYELSVFAICDGENYKILPAAQDHKRVGDGDTGPNTGGMGAYAPTPLVNDDIYKKLEDRVIKPTLKGMQEENAPFEGVLFIGVMVVKGEPIVLEYNVRFGDPECEILMPLIESKVSELFYYGATKQLDKLDIKFKDKFAVGVVMASSNYPYSSSAPSIISLSNIVDKELLENSHISFAGVEEKDGNLIATGGRVAVCVAIGDTIKEARDRAYLLSSEISFDGKKFRTDIAYQALKN